MPTTPNHPVEQLLTVAQVADMFANAGLGGKHVFYRIYRHKVKFGYYGLDPDGRTVRTMRAKRSHVEQLIASIIANPVYLDE